MSARRYWIGVAAANHVARGKADGFMQVNHGKQAPLKRVQPSDILAYYSPVETFGGKDSLKAFTALGVVSAGKPFQGDMGDGFKPFGRNVRWLNVVAAPIAPLLEQLSFITNKRQWGYKFRFGFFEIPEDDMQIIAAAMGHPRLPLA